MNRFLQLLKWFLSPLETCVEHSQSRGLHQLADGVGICGDKILILAESSPSPSRGGELSSIHNSNQLLAENNILRKIKSNQAKKVNPSSRLSPPFRGGLGWGLLKEMTSPNPSNTSATLSTSIGRYYRGHNSNNGTSENNTPSKSKSKQAKNSNATKSKLPLPGRGLGRGLFFVLCTLYSILSTAQSFPVQVIPQALPPAPIYISNYADASTVTSPLRVQIILNDFEIANREIRLKTYFTGSGLSFQSNDIVVGASPLFLEGGIPLVLTNVELAPYFEFTNITGINANQYGNAIPEGAYQFCVEVYDVLTGSRLSNKSCAVSVVFQNEPPFLVLPRNKTNVDEINPQYIVFQWTPRSINVSNVEYELSLVEIWDTQVDPQQAFLSSPPVFQTTTSATTYVYGPSDPLLLSGKNYAWRVQAKAKQGIEEIGLFKNEGYSEIYSFSYASACELPLVFNHEVKGSTNANIFWDDFSTEIPEYTVRYRQKNVPDAEWFLAKTAGNELTIWELKAGTTYEYQLSKNCDVTQSDWSFTKEFTTALEFEEESVLDCGVSPDINLTNMEPLASIGNGETFVAGDFPVKILEVSGSNGRFTGKGYVSLPYLKNIKVAVEFTNILINTDRDMAEGSIITVYDPTWKNILDVDIVIDVADDILDEFTGPDENVKYTTDFEIESVDNIKIEDGKIVVTGPNGQIKTFDHDDGDSYEIKDSQGNVFNIDGEGKITKGSEAAQDGPATAQNTDGISGGSGTTNSPSVANITASGVTISFEPINGTTKYYIDEADSDYERANYPKAKLPNGNDYYPMHKAVVDGQSDQFNAVVEITNPKVTMADLVVQTVAGNKIDFVVEGSKLRITVKGVNSYRNEEAIISYKDESGKYKIAASFFVHHIKQQEVTNVVVVAVGDAAPLTGLQTQLNTIFGKAGATLNVTTKSLSLIQSDWDENNNGQLDYDGSGLISNYPQELKNIQQKYKEKNSSWDRSAYHLFLLPSNMPISEPLEGFMPKTRQWGYIFNARTTEEASLENKKSDNLTAAHELGHGAFRLDHPFSNDKNTAGSGTNWLMDYGVGTQLSYSDWARMSDESLNIGVFQDQEDGELRAYEYFIGRNVLTNNFSSYGEDDNSYSFITKAGKILTLPKEVEDVTFDDDGLLSAFTVLENGTKERYVSTKYKSDNLFAGFRKNFDDKESTNNSNIYKDYLSKDFTGNRAKVYLGLKSVEPCEVGLHKSTFPIDVSGEWNSGGNDRAMATILNIASELVPEGPGINVLFVPLNKKVDFVGNYNSPSKCSSCENGTAFYEKYAPSSKPEERESLLKVSILICERGNDFYNALESQITKINNDKFNGYFANTFDKKVYALGLQSFWDNSNAWELYANRLIELKDLFDNNSDLNNVNTDDLFFLLNYFSLEMIDQLSLNEKLDILEFIFNNETFIVDDTWLSFFSETEDEEGAILRLIASIKSEEASKFLDQILIRQVGDKSIFRKLFKHIDDNLGKNHYTLLNQILFGLIIDREGGVEQYINKYKDAQNIYPWLHERDLWVFINRDIKYVHSMDDFGTLTFRANLVIQNEFRSTDEDEDGNEIRTLEINCLSNDCSPIGMAEFQSKNKAKVYKFLDIVPETIINNPYEVILVQFGSDIDLDGNPGTVEISAGSILPIPAFFFKYTLDKNRWTMLKRSASDGTTIATSVLAVTNLVGKADKIARFLASATLLFNATNPIFSNPQVSEWLNKTETGKQFLTAYRTASLLTSLAGTVNAGDSARRLAGLMSSYFKSDGIYYNQLGAPFSQEFDKEFKEILLEIDKLER